MPLESIELCPCSPATPSSPIPQKNIPLGALGNFSLCPCAWLSERQRELAKAALRRQGLLGAPTAPKPTPKRSEPLFLFSKCVFHFSWGNWETQRIKSKSLGPCSAGSVQPGTPSTIKYPAFLFILGMIWWYGFLWVSWGLAGGGPG